MSIPNHQIALAYLDANMVADRAGMARQLARDVKMWIPRSGAEKLGSSNPMTGSDSILDFLAGARKAFYAPDKIPTYTVLHAFSAGDMALVHFHLRAETSRGVAYENTYLILVRIAGGVIAEFWEYTDTTHAFAAFNEPRTA